MADVELSVRNLNVVAGSKSILRNVDFELRGPSLTALMGPMGSGKSTFLKFLTGQNFGSDVKAEFDGFVYRGSKSGTKGRPVYIGQKTRETSRDPEQSHQMIEQRLNEVHEACEGNGDVLCIDEPTAGLTREDGELLMAQLSETAKQRPVLLVSHNADEVQRYCDHVALFGGGRMLDHLTRDAFFTAAEGSHAERFVRTSGLDIPNLDTPVTMLNSEHRPLPAEFDIHPMASGDPSTWIIRDRLELRRMALLDEAGNPVSGASLPGQRIFSIHRNKVTVLEDQNTVDEFDWKASDRRPDHDKAAVARVCLAIESALKDGKPVAINFDANLAGTAAVIGSFMVLRGSSPEEAARLASSKMPDLHFGLRLEQLFWDMDIEFGLSG